MSFRECNASPHWLKHYLNNLTPYIENGSLCRCAKMPAWLHGGIYPWLLTHWSRVTHICVVKLTIIGSDSGLSSGWHQAIILTTAGILLIEPSGINFGEILFRLQVFSFKKMHLKMSSGKWCPFCIGLNIVRMVSVWWCDIIYHRPYLDTLYSDAWYHKEYCTNPHP